MTKTVKKKVRKKTKPSKKKAEFSKKLAKSLKKPVKSPKKKVKFSVGFLNLFKKSVKSTNKKSLLKTKKTSVRKQKAPKSTIDKRILTLKGNPSKKLKDSINDPYKFILTGIPGFDRLFDKGIPKGSAVLLAGGAGCGKTIFGMQTLYHHAKEGKKCMYMSFEESEEKLKGHMNSFGWNVEDPIKSGNLIVKKFSPFEVSRSVEALLEKEKGSLLIDVDPLILPKGFKPDFIVLDSLTAVGSAFVGKADSYRIYLEQLFNFFERLGCTTFLITETEQSPKQFSSFGAEEFLADGVIVLYNMNRKDIKQRAIEVLKMRGEGHKQKIVAMAITPKGIEVYHDQGILRDYGES